jgi:hypothetical protein
MINESIKKLVISGKFLDAEKLITTLNQELARTIIRDLVYDYKNIAAYSFNFFFND